MHEHAPSKYQSHFVTFFYLLISPKKVFTCYADGADICGICGVHIVVPYFYYSPVTKLLYALFGVLLAFIVAALPYLHFLAILFGASLFHHIYSAMVFAFAPWDTYDPEVRSSASCSREAKKDLIKKLIWLIVGFLAPLLVVL